MSGVFGALESTNFHSTGFESDMGCSKMFAQLGISSLLNRLRPATPKASQATVIRIYTGISSNAPLL